MFHFPSLHLRAHSAVFSVCRSPVFKRRMLLPMDTEITLLKLLIYQKFISDKVKAILIRFTSWFKRAVGSLDLR